MVDWAKSSIFFRDMTTEDQMSLLHETWSELVLLDHIYRQVWFSDSESILLVNGKSLPLNDLSSMFDVSGCKLIERVAELSNRFRQIQIDRTELVCLKFLILFNVKGKYNFKLRNHPIRVKCCIYFMQNSIHEITLFQ
jgi:nuclear receptor subfamily 5 group A protein 2